MSSTDHALVAAAGATRQGLLAGLRSWIILPIILAGAFMITLDFFIVNVAIPSMQRDLHGGAASVQFVVAGYGLAYAAPLLIGGRLGDLYGRRRMFALGVGLFTLASGACGLAPTMAVLTATRVLQGLAALLGPQVLAILGVTFTGESRARAFTAYGLTLGLAAVFGQLLGGLLIEANLAGLGWRSCFLINLPIGAAALALTPRLVPESRAPGRPRLDILGMILVTLALLATVLPLIEGREQGWPTWTWLCLITAMPLFLAFAAYQRRLGARGGAP
ncbi:MAG TPA: MFS transporter [Chloroflexota bacterium]|nr:MFS transporter [Chloroflexota bacterium]